MSEASQATPSPEEARAQRDAARKADRKRWKEHARIHFVMGMGALTLWGAADAWAAVSGLAIAHAASIANALIASTIVASIVHEWGHFAGARLSGAVSPALEKRANHFFMFDFPFDRNDGRQFVWMSWGGILAPWALVLLVLVSVPLDGLGRIVLLAGFVTRAVQVAIFEVPVVRRAMDGGDPRNELGRQIAAGFGRSRLVGNAAGVAAFLVFWLAA